MVLGIPTQATGKNSGLVPLPLCFLHHALAANDIPPFQANHRFFAVTPFLHFFNAPLRAP
jgi:hypothetical protein